MPATQKISPCLWFDGRAEEAAKFYTSIFPDSQIDHIARTIDTPGAKEGAVILVEFADQAEVDRLCAHRRRRQACAVRLAQGQVRRLLADRARACRA